jgi:large subunit ribosomal protein L40e
MTARAKPDHAYSLPSHYLVTADSLLIQCQCTVQTLPTPPFHCPFTAWPMPAPEIRTELDGDETLRRIRCHTQEGGGGIRHRGLTNTNHRTEDELRPATLDDGHCPGAVRAKVKRLSYLQDNEEQKPKLETQLNSKCTPRNIFERGTQPESNYAQETDQFKCLDGSDLVLIGDTAPLSMAKTFQIFVKNLRGKSVPLEVKASDTIETVKQKLQDQDGIAREWQRLMFAGKILQDEGTVTTYSITAGVTLHLMMRLRGGPTAATRNRV